MPFFSRVAAALRGNPLDNPAVPLSAPAQWMFDLFGGAPSAAGVAVNDRTAMQLATVYSCVNVIASDVSSLPLKVYEDTKKGRHPAIDSDLYYLLAVEPNPEMTPATFIATWLGSAVLTGNGYAEIQRDGTKPVALWPRHPHHTKPVRANGTEKLSSAGTAKAGDLVYRVNDTGETRYVPAKDMLHLSGLSMDGWLGLSPIQAARQTIGTAIAAEKFGAGFFGRGSRPSGILSNSGTLTDKDKIQSRQSWEAANSGDNQGRTAVLWGGWTWTKIGISPGEAQFLETQQYTRAQIAALFRLPPHMVGDTGRLSNSNHESMALEYVNFTLRPWLVRIEMELQRKLVPTLGRKAGKYTVRFDVSELTRGDFASRMNGYAVGRQWGFFTTNYILEQLGINPVGPKGDQLYIPLNMVPMGEEPDTDPPDPNVDEANGEDADEDADPSQGPQPKGNGGRNQRLLLARMGNAYLGIFRDAVGRVTARSKRDADAIAQVFTPVLELIAAESRRQASSMFRVPEIDQLDTDRFVRDCRKALEKRASAWTAETVASDAQKDLDYCVRAIAIGVFREAGSMIALGTQETA